MKWQKLKEKWPESNSEVVVCYYTEFQDATGKPYGSFGSELVHEKLLEHITMLANEDIYWVYPPEREVK